MMAVGRPGRSMGKVRAGLGSLWWAGAWPHTWLDQIIYLKKV